MKDDLIFIKKTTTLIYFKLEDDLERKEKNLPTAQHIFPGNLTNTTTKNILAQLKK